MKDVPTQPIVETITPLVAPKNGVGADRDDFKNRFRLKGLIVVCSFALLIVGGGWLLYFLSKEPLQPEEAETSPLPVETAAAENSIEPPQEARPEVDPARLEMEKTTAEQKLAEYLEAKGELDHKAASEWEKEAYLEITELERQADDHFKKNQYNQASELYVRAHNLAVELIGRAGPALDRLLAEGHRALDEGDGSLARHHFSVALKIAPTDARAQKGLKRAETIETVMQLIGSGRQHEANSALSLAGADYSKALQIDSDSEKARQGLDRINALILEEQFQELMSDGLAAFHRNEYTIARTQLLKAKSLKPGSREVSDALFQVDQAIRLSNIDKLRLAAQKAEQSEDWQKALKSYLAVLDIDKNLQFAVRGKELALEQIQIAKRVQFFLAKPQILELDSQLKNANRLILEAEEISPRGPILTAQITKLEQLVAVAQTPVKIAIESDNLTRVAVYKVGKLGRFSVHELELRPGTYTIVGTRDGYQDVRQKIVVKPELQSLRITVKCRVKI
jgi:eukaryotic-like serine/threonine-protein kinase